MSGSIKPISCCDRDCAQINGCTIGGYECEGCGKWFCATDLDADGYCDDCAAKREEEDEEDDEDYDVSAYCPFCGHHMVIYNWETFECDHCGYRVSTIRDIEDQIKENGRVANALAVFAALNRKAML